MDYRKSENIIRTLRKEKNLTQKQLAEILHISDKAVSKWECGAGSPDTSILPILAEALGTDIENIINGYITKNRQNGGNMKRTRFYYCHYCGSLSACTGNSSVSCCGHKLEALVPNKADENNDLTLELVEDEWYITCNHPMTKDNYITFIAFMTGDTLRIIKQYPEWEIHCRLPRRPHGTLLWHSSSLGLLYKYL